MTKLLQQLNFSSNFSSNYFDVDVDGFESNSAKNYYGDGASLNTSASAGSKRSALSASDAECFSLCLGAGPLCSAPPGGVNSGASSPATPSTPSHDDNRDLLCALLWSSGSSVCGSAETLSEAAPPPRPDPRLDQAVLDEILEKKDRRPVKVDFRIFLTESTNTRWQAVVSGSSMFLRVPSVLQSGSKESFLRLLDFAEEKLGCTNCIICVLKSRADRPTLIRTFMFMGFTVLPPGAPVLPREIHNNDYIFLHYNME